MYAEDNNRKKKRSYQQGEKPSVFGSSVDSLRKANKAFNAEIASWARDAFDSINPRYFGYATVKPPAGNTALVPYGYQETAGDYFKAHRIAKGITSVWHDAYKYGRDYTSFGRYNLNWWDPINFANRPNPDDEVFKALAKEAEKKNWRGYYSHMHEIYPATKLAYQREEVNRFYRRRMRAKRKAWWWKRRKRKHWSWRNRRY